MKRLAESYTLHWIFALWIFEQAIYVKLDTMDTKPPYFAGLKGSKVLPSDIRDDRTDRDAIAVQQTMLTVPSRETSSTASASGDVMAAAGRSSRNRAAFTVATSISGLHGAGSHGPLRRGVDGEHRAGINSASLRRLPGQPQHRSGTAAGVLAQRRYSDKGLALTICLL